MGSPLGPTLVNVFLCFHERKWIEDCPNAFKPLWYQRYVDDIFLLFSSVNHLVSFKDYLNTKHPNINFTFEKEKDNSFSFLDVKIG